MKKITQVADTGGGPITKADLRVVFNLEIWDVLEAMFEGYDTDTQGIIVSGCELSGSVGNYTISAGIVYLDGEFRRFAQQTGLSLPQYIKAATDTNDSRTFEDASSKVLFITESADLATSAPGTQYVPFTSTTSADGRRFNRPLTSTVTKKSKQINIGDWDMDSTAFILVDPGIADWKKIRSISVILRNDADTTYYKLESADSSGNSQGYIGEISSLGIAVNRITGGVFDSTDFNATSYNRGWLTIEYEG